MSTSTSTRLLLHPDRRHCGTREKGQERVMVGVFLKAVLVKGKDSVFALKDCWVIWRFVRLTTSAVDIVYNGGAIWSKGVIEGRWRLGRCERGYEGEYNPYRWSSEYYSL